VLDDLRAPLSHAYQYTMIVSTTPLKTLAAVGLAVGLWQLPPAAGESESVLVMHRSVSLFWLCSLVAQRAAAQQKGGWQSRKVQSPS
jgi:hypothetical protein